MANSSEGKFGNIYKLLSQHNFQSSVTDKFKCMKCQNILINACITECGCQFCRNCVDKMLLNGFEKCPGNTGDCKNENLSNIMPDYRMNLKISKLLVKCPEQMCEFECQLMEMEDHLRLCSKKSVQCPCHDLGCHDDNLVVDKINEHLQTESYNHWTMLMGFIGDLRNEVAQLRRTENAYKNEMEMLREEGRAKDERIEAMRSEMTDEIRKCQVETEMLREDGRAKDERIEAMRSEMTDEIRICQVETEMLRRQIDIGKETIDRKIDAMAAEMNGKIESIKAETNKSIKTEMAELSGQLNGKLERVRVEMDKRMDEKRRECMKDVERQLGLKNETMVKYQKEIARRMDGMKICGENQIYGTRFVWPVAIVTWFKIPFDQTSEYFSPKSNKYKMQLRMNVDYSDSQFQIRLLIYPGPNDANLQWPFQAKVTVKITNKAQPGACEQVTKSCKIDRPPTNKFKCSDPFLFPKSDLFTKGLLQDEWCIVECLVDIE